MKTKLFIFFIFFGFWATAQNNNLSIVGTVYDKATSEVISYATVAIEGTSNGVITDSLGTFILTDLNKGNYHLIISHVGCENVRKYIELTRDTFVRIEIDHFGNILDQVILKEHHEFHSLDSYAKTEISKQSIRASAEKNFSDQLTKITGVRILQNGGNISKPIVNGLSGNRVSILNNGLVQSGQQWGNDHAPEIDPFSANEITVVKGASVVEYPVSSLGGLILIDAGEIEEEPHIHGSLTYAFESIGRGNSINANAEKFSDLLSWKANATLRKKGDGHTPDYFLTNTGAEEFSTNLKLEKKFNPRYSSSLYVSNFYTNLGILGASHISNLTDLESAINREIPFGLNPNFSYEINAPSQQVNHFLAKWSNKLFLSDNSWLNADVGFQNNRRKEFDVRRATSADKPSLSLNQYTLNTSLKYTLDGEEFIHKLGIQNNLTQNINVPGTGISPLIPNYALFKLGGFYSFIKEWNKWETEIGGRLDFINQQALVFSQSLPKEIISYENNFYNVLFSSGVSYQPSENWDFKASLGLHTRSPEINELYSNGLHQGVSGIELGNANLSAERSIKISTTSSYEVIKKLNIQVDLYSHYFDNYIYLLPTGENRLTIRGAFPVFEYTETPAQINGLDITAHFSLNQFVSYNPSYSLIRATNLENNRAIPFIPTDMLRNEILIIGKDFMGFQNTRLLVSHEFHFQKQNITSEEDFGPIPEAFNLFNLNISTSRAIAHKQFRLYIRGENLFNTRYRSYTNRLRYFADERGRNIVLGCNVEF